jgi:hypothetical protein
MDTACATLRPISRDLAAKKTCIAYYGWSGCILRRPLLPVEDRKPRPTGSGITTRGITPVTNWGRWMVF